MSIDFNHTILRARDSEPSARFLAEMLEADGDITPQHYAFLVGEDEFDGILGRIRERALPYWADPSQTQPAEINRHDGGRGVYFEDPNGHLLEIITRPYGSGGWNP